MFVCVCVLRVLPVLVHDNLWRKAPLKPAAQCVFHQASPDFSKEAWNSCIVEVSPNMVVRQNMS